MREIKFRAWDKSAKRMTLLSVEYDSDVGGFYIEGNYVSKSHSDPMQYTGLKDKNDVEIYEGDIVKYFHQYDTDRPTGQSKVIVWNSNHRQTGFNITVPKNFEVLGNIYENPELLK